MMEGSNVVRTSVAKSDVRPAGNLAVKVYMRIQEEPLQMALGDMGSDPFSGMGMRYLGHTLCTVYEQRGKRMAQHVLGDMV